MLPWAAGALGPLGWSLRYVWKASMVPGAGTITRASVFPVAVHWAAGDWRILPTPATSYARLTAAPGSQQAASLGWLQLTGEQS